jgi:hypothetical protein
MYHVNGIIKISSHLTVITYRDIDRMIKACNEHVYRVENNITFNKTEPTLIGGF